MRYIWLIALLVYALVGIFSSRFPFRLSGFIEVPLAALLEPDEVDGRLAPRGLREEERFGARALLLYSGLLQRHKYYVSRPNDLGIDKIAVGWSGGGVSGVLEPEVSGFISRREAVLDELEGAQGSLAALVMMTDRRKSDPIRADVTFVLNRGKRVPPAIVMSQPEFAGFVVVAVAVGAIVGWFMRSSSAKSSYDAR